MRIDDPTYKMEIGQMQRTVLLETVTNPIGDAIFVLENYKRFLLVGQNIQPQTNDVNGIIQLSSNYGLSWISGASDYLLTGYEQVGNVTTIFNSTGTAQHLLNRSATGGRWSTGVGRKAYFRVWVDMVLAESRTISIKSICTHITTNNTHVTVWAASTLNSTESSSNEVNALRVTCSTDGINTGEIRLYGWV